jgi:two-component system sensor histidine kinase KdpD
MAGALLPARGQMAGATVGLLMLVPTVLATALGGPLAAGVAVIAGSLMHNLLFTAPYLTLRMTEPAEVASLGVHTVVAVIVSLVVVREQRATRLAHERQEAADRVEVLEEVDRARTALLGAVSHDLRTPLSAIAAAASDLCDQDVTFSPQQQRLLLETISERATYLDRTVEQLLAASRLQAGAITVLAEAVELQDLVDEAKAGFPADEGARIELLLVSRPPPVLADPVLVVVVLRNLLENALRHAPADSSVVVTGAKAGDVVVIDVSDEGPGMADDPAAMFDAFRGDSTGPGLGLAIARGFVELHGAKLTYVDAPGGGATFEFALPAVAEPDA